MLDEATSKGPRASRIKAVVLGMGNLLLKDEGIGVHVAHALEGTASSGAGELEVIDGGTLPDVFLLLDGVDKLIVVDAVQAGGEPGAIYRFSPNDIEVNDQVLTSLHQVSLLQSLKLAEGLGRGPRNTVIIGVEPQETDSGVELSAKLKERIPQIIKVVLKEISSKPIDEPGKEGRE